MSENYSNSQSAEMARLPNHYLYFILSFKPIINKEVIKLFQNYNKTLE